MTQDIVGKLFGDRGYISQSLFEQLYKQGLQLITRRKKNMKQRCSALGGFPDLKRLHQEAASQVDGQNSVTKTLFD
jgi:hypothetical protein